MKGVPLNQGKKDKVVSLNKYKNNTVKEYKIILMYKCIW